MSFFVKLHVLLFSILLVNIRSTLEEETTNHDLLLDNEESETKLCELYCGHWIEDQYQRKNLNNYLYEMGMSWFKRVYATSSSWEDELRIHIDDGWLNVNGLRGPFAEPYQFSAIMDNQTLAEMDIGAFGDKTLSTVGVVDGSIVSYVRKPSSQNLFFTVTDRMDPYDTNVLHVEYKHLDTDVVWKSVFNRKIYYVNGKLIMDD
jgi:hypothetical protein